MTAEGGSYKKGLNRGKFWEKRGESLRQLSWRTWRNGPFVTWSQSMLLYTSRTCSACGFGRTKWEDQSTYRICFVKFWLRTSTLSALIIGPARGAARTISPRAGMSSSTASNLRLADGNSTCNEIPVARCYIISGRWGIFGVWWVNGRMGRSVFNLYATRALQVSIGRGRKSI